jgi:type VI secretion system lysozyme-like protein
MSSDRGLFDRLRDPDRGGFRSAHQRTDRIYASVMTHLHQMLNTRRDDSSSVPEFGLPALTDIDVGTRVEELRRAIEQSIRSYEPRLAGVRVQLVPPDPDEPTKVRFQITAGLATSDERVRVRFDTLVDGSGSWKVTS